MPPSGPTAALLPSAVPQSPSESDLDGHDRAATRTSPIGPHEDAIVGAGPTPPVVAAAAVAAPSIPGDDDNDMGGGAIVPTENQLFPAGADQFLGTGRRGSDTTPITALDERTMGDSARGAASPDGAESTPSKTPRDDKSDGVDDLRKGSILPPTSSSAVDQPHHLRLPLHHHSSASRALGPQSQPHPHDAGSPRQGTHNSYPAPNHHHVLPEADAVPETATYVVKTASTSPQSPRVGLGRLLNPLNGGVNPRIHPVTFGSNALDGQLSGDLVPDGATPRLTENDAEGDDGETKELTVTTIKPGPPKKTRSQRAIFVRTQESLHDLFERPKESKRGRMIHRFIFVCILLNIIMLAFETCDGPNHGSAAPGYPFLPDASVYRAFETVFTIIFSVEFAGRLVARKCSRDLIMDPVVLVEGLALCPWYLERIMDLSHIDFHVDAVNGVAHVIGLLRLLRVLRIVSILRNYESSKILRVSIAASLRPLGVTIFFLFTLSMLLATAIFFAEPCQNISTCAFTDMFNAMYFILVTLTTVGYGNQVPSKRNIPAMAISCIAMIFGQLYLAMPLAIVGNNFQDTYENFTQKKRRKFRQHDSTLAAFDSIKLNRQAQRLNDIQYHFLDAWRVVSINLDKFLRKGREGMGSEPAESLVQAQIQRYTKIREAIDKLMEIHTEASQLLQHFIPHKRKHQRSSVTSSQKDGVLSQVYLKARLVLAKARYRSNLHRPTDPGTVANTRRGRLWLVLEVPDSSRLASAINMVMVVFTLFSIVVFFCESVPELMNTGLHTQPCRSIVEKYCKTSGFYDLDGPAGGDMPDFGCFVRFQNLSTDFTRQINFTCFGEDDSSSCYGSGVNIGSNAVPCASALDYRGSNEVCDRLQCVKSSSSFNMEPYWIYLEWCFGITFLGELILRFYASRSRSHFFRDFYNIFDVLAVFPFLMEVAEYLFLGVRPSYAIVASSPSFFSIIRVLKTMRILKLTRHFRGTQVLAQTARDVHEQLTIPIFFLFTMCLLAAAMYFEIERGVECFVGSKCTWWGKNVLTPELAEGLPVGKRVLIQDTRPVLITDMIHSTWLSFATFTTVGYGDVRPRTSIGKVFTIMVAVVGTIYTAMPITLVGEKFYSLYERHAEKISIRRGGSSTSWKTKRKISVRKKDDGESSDSSVNSQAPKVFKLEQEDFDMIQQFTTMKKTFLNLQRNLDNLKELNKDILSRIKSQNDVNKAGNRKSDGIERAIEEKSNAILDTLLQFSQVVGKLQDAPQLYEAFIADTHGQPAMSELEKLVSPDFKNRLSSH